MEERDRLSRALGQAYLQHQVSQLEKSVGSMDISSGRGSSRGGGQRGRGRGRGQGQAADEGIGKGKAKQEVEKVQVRVLDASVLVHALAVVKRWTKDRKVRLVIPLDAISTLDRLKTSSALGQQVRESTRWLDSRPLSDPSGSGRANNDKLEPGLVAQAEAESLSWADVERFDVPAEDGEAAEQEAPKRVRPTLQCAAWWAQHHPCSSPTLVVYHPHPTSAPLGDDDDELGSGRATSSWAGRLGIKVRVLTDEEVARSTEWVRKRQEARRRGQRATMMAQTDGQDDDGGRARPREKK